MTIQPRRVVVTGIGVLCAAGTGQQAFFEGLCSPAPEPPLLVDSFDPTPLFNSTDELNNHDRYAQLALAAAAEALDQASNQASNQTGNQASNLNCDPTRIGVHIGTGVGGIASFTDQVLTNQNSPEQVQPLAVSKFMPNAAAVAVALRYGFRGPCESTAAACASSTLGIGSAAQSIRWGQSDIVLAGGSEASHCPLAAQGLTNMTAVSSVGISRPFDAERDGFLQAEGAAVLVLEERDHAIARNAEILAEVLGYGTNSDAYHITAPSPGGVGARACMELALQDANLTPDQVVHINAHGTSTPLNDASEAEAIHKLFGSPGPLVTSTKGVTGHGLGAGGALEAAAVILAMQHKLIPPTANYLTPDPDMPSIQLVTEPTEWQLGVSLSNSFGFGGHNAVLVLAPHP